LAGTKRRRSRLLTLTNPWTVRGIEIRGEAEVSATGGKEVMPIFDDEIIRIRPRRIVSWGVDGEMDSVNARSVG